MSVKTLESYLRENHERGVIDHRVRADVDLLGRVTFYIHPDSVDGDTLDFAVEGHILQGI